MSVTTLNRNTCECGWGGPGGRSLAVSAFTQGLGSVPGQGSEAARVTQEGKEGKKGSAVSQHDEKAARATGEKMVKSYLTRDEY